MNALMVADRWDETGGGRERYLAELRASLVRGGHTVSVLTRTTVGERRMQGSVEAFRRAHPGCRVLAVRPAPGATHYQLHSGTYAAAFAAERDAIESRVRRMFFRPALHLNARRQRLLDIESRLLDAGSDTRVMAFSTRSRDDLQRIFRLPEERVVVDRPGVDLDVFRPVSAGEADAVQVSHGDRVRLLFAGHNFVLKGLRPALHALALARRGGINAEIIVAGGDHPRVFRALARRLGLEAQVQFVGRVTQDTLATLYRHSHLLVHPAFYDPFPRVIVEALASGVPVVTTAACGGAELIVPGRNGFVVDDPRNVDAIAGAIAAVSISSRRAPLSTAAAETGRSFDFQRHAEVVTRWLTGP